MIFEQYYLECLSHASYLVGDERTGAAVVVDPQRDIGGYLRDAEHHGLRIEHVIETHFHADFVSGHLELAAATGAVIAYGAAARGADFPIERLEDGRRIVLGDVELEILATPGHTPESICIVVHERAGAPPYGVLTGDTLFIGDVGRPDLLASAGFTADELARALYHSTRERLLMLPDATRIFPAHGSGSACGKQLSTETVSTIGEQRRTNYALQPMTEDEFVAVVTEGQPTIPPYFAFDVERNRAQRELLDEAPPDSLTLDEVLRHQAEGAVVLDTREAAEFARGHLRGAVNVGLGGRFAEYAGDVCRPEQAIVLVSEPGTELEARIRLGRIGFDRVVGALDDPLRALFEHPGHVEVSARLTAGELAERRRAAAIQLVDVRGGSEVALGRIDDAIHVPLAELLARLGDLDPDRPTVVYCGGGYRSSVAASTLSAHGFTDVSDLLGGYDAWVAWNRSQEGETR